MILEISSGEGSKKFVAVKNVNFLSTKEKLSHLLESGSGKTTNWSNYCSCLNDTSKGISSCKKLMVKITWTSFELIRRIQMIFHNLLQVWMNVQRLTISFLEGLYNHHLFKDEEERKEKVKNIIREVGLLAEHSDTLSTWVFRWTTPTYRNCPVPLVMQLDFSYCGWANFSLGTFLYVPKFWTCSRKVPKKN